MSEQSLEQISVKSAAEEIRMRAAAWLERRAGETWSEEDQVTLEQWLDASPSHRIAYLRVEAAWQRTYRLAALRVPQRTSVRQRVLPIIVKVAAALTALGVIGLVASSLVAVPRQQTYATGLGGRTTLLLSDGSHIELNTETVLHAAVTGGTRTVQLEKGEAYFDIVHDPSHPFTVIAGNRRIVDLGTKFVVQRDAGRLQVSLIEGRARLDLGDSGAKTQSVILTPGDVIVASHDTLFVSKRSAPALDNELGWRRGLLIFNQTTLADAVQQFNRYNAKKLVVSDPVAARHKIFGTFQSNNAELFARVAQEAFGFHVHGRGNEIVIER